MIRFVIRRVFQTVFIVFLLSFVCFQMMSWMPGDPVEMLVQSNPRMTPADVVRLKKFYGLDQPAYLRYSHWAEALLKGDLGYSRTYKIPVSEIIGAKLMNTFYLSMASLLLSLLLAIPLGVYTSLHPGGKLDYLANLFAFMGISFPSFWLSILLILMFSVHWQWFPSGGTYTIGLEGGDFDLFLDRLKYLALPTMTLTLLHMGRFLRFTRSAVQETLKQDYVRTAKAKGLRPTVVLWKHSFRNALLPLITVITLSFSGIFSGATITETVFAYQGVGKLVYDSILSNDFNVAMVSFMISIMMVLFFNLLADLLYAWADPRISYK